MSEKSGFYTVFRIFILNYLLTFGQKTKETCGTLKRLVVFGLNPSIKNTEKSSEEEINDSKLLFNFIAVLIVLRIFFREVLGKESFNVPQVIHSIYLLLLYFIGLNLFLLLGRLLSLFNTKDNKSLVDKMFILEFNFLFMISLVLSFILERPDGKYIIFFIIIHTTYFSIKLFYSEFKTHVLIKFIFSVLVIILSFLILVIPLAYFIVI